MKKLVIGFTVLLVTVFATSSLAGDTKVALYLGGGMSLPQGPDDIMTFEGLKIGIKDVWKTGKNFGGGIGMTVHPTVELLTRVSYNSFAVDDNGFADAIERLVTAGSGVTEIGVNLKSDGGTLKVFEFMADIKFHLAGEKSSFSPYLLGGLGMASAKIDDMDINLEVSYEGVSADTSFTVQGDSETKLAYEFGAGADIMFSPQIGIFVEAKYAAVTTTGASTSYLPIRGGLKFRFGN